MTAIMVSLIRQKPEWSTLPDSVRRVALVRLISEYILIMEFNRRVLLDMTRLSGVMSK